MVFPQRGPELAGSHRAQLYSDALHAAVVLTVVICATVADLVSVIPQDIIGTVYGGAIGYAAGRAGNVQRTRGEDP